MDAVSRRIERALDALSGRERSCDLCPRDCRVDRTADAAGVCGIGRRAGLASALLHYGEEPVLSGLAGPPGPGSGTIFLTGCNLKCLFCQNHQISWGLEGRPVSDEELAAEMLGLQARGALNINLVSPSHVVVPVLRALLMARAGGLRPASGLELERLREGRRRGAAGRDRRHLSAGPEVRLARPVAALFGGRGLFRARLDGAAGNVPSAARPGDRTTTGSPVAG